MRPNVICMTLALAALTLSGCAKSDWRTARTGPNNHMPMDDAAILDAKETTPPKILPETHFRAAQLFESQGQFSKAVVQYQKAIATNHNYTAAYHQLGLLFGQLGRHPEAVEALARASQLDADDPAIMNNLGFAYAQMRQWDKAETCFARARELRPDFARAAVNHGMALAHLGRFEESLEAFQTCLGDAEAYFNLGLMFRAQRRYEDAAYAFDQAVRLQGDFTAARVQLDELCARLAWVAPLPASDRLRPWLPSTRMIVAYSGPEEAQRFFGNENSLASTVVEGQFARQPIVRTNGPSGTISLGRRASTRTEGQQFAVLHEVASGRTTFALNPSTKTAIRLLETLHLEPNAVMFATMGRKPHQPNAQQAPLFASTPTPQLDPETGRPCDELWKAQQRGQNSLASTVIEEQQPDEEWAIPMRPRATTKSPTELAPWMQGRRLDPDATSNRAGAPTKTGHTGQTPPRN